MVEAPAPESARPVAPLMARPLTLPSGQNRPLICPPLTSGEVHLWRATLELSTAHLGALYRTLADDERARAERFCFARDQAQLRFRYDCACGRPGCLPEHRKPALDPDAHPGTPQFNLSHTAGRALVAVTSDRAVGIDLEAPGALPDATAIMAIALSPEERALVLQWPEADRSLACYQCWTAKDAYLKARGLGLAIGAGRVELSPEAPGAIRLRTVAGDQAEARRWVLRPLAPFPGYVGALVVARTPAPLPIKEHP